MTVSDTRAPRANRDGDQCPPWCTQDHDLPLIPDNPAHGYIGGHWSDPSAVDGVRVSLGLQPGLDTAPKVCLSGNFGLTSVFFSLAEADKVAVILGQAGAGLLAALVRAAVATAREAA